MPARRRAPAEALVHQDHGNNADKVDKVPHWDLESKDSKESRDSKIDTNRNQETKKAWRVQEWATVSLLTFLYVLQGIPLGLSSSIPMLLQNRQVTYTQQAVYSFVNWPFSMKLLWAPLVDSWYSSRMGRRKTWLVPTQYLIGIFMLVLSGHCEYLLGDDTAPPNVTLMTVVFFSLCFLAATQDIAVDGWALTILSRENVGFASTCNCVGQTAGYFIGFVVFLALESADFCNAYLRDVPLPRGLVTLGDFMYIWGWIFLITTTLVWILKREGASSSAGDEDRGVLQTYSLLWKVLKLPNVRLLIFCLLTSKVGFSAPDVVTGLKLTEHGVPKDTLALLAVPLVPLQIVLPLVISKYTTGKQPMTVFMKAIPYRLMFGIIFPLIVYVTPLFQTSPGRYHPSYYAILIGFYALQQVAATCMFVSIMAFFARISDPAIGGTYMTLLNTVFNLGGNWPATLALCLVDPLSSKQCVITPPDGVVRSCAGPSDVQRCRDDGGACVTLIDGYYLECLACIVLGLVWLKRVGPKVMSLQNETVRSWKCPE